MPNRAGHPYANTRLTKFLERRISDLRPKKTQSAIAAEAGFKSINMLTMLKTGASRLPLDRVPALAGALDCDFVRLFTMAVEQISPVLARMINEKLRLVTENEIQIVESLRDASGHTDPHLSRKLEKAIREVFE